ncbi:hypothetical protein [Roseibium aggregatum]|uniref:DUF35 domain-containing protein n=1 Tax=Roseibium aggregatum TaxID=187304 RepID=A0A939J3Y8_9HYPH|nr:hypothetical protein [Roseibium aggregatum]MBN9673003.1 hypothetical protein [Roseibium aggregatum]
MNPIAVEICDTCGRAQLTGGYACRSCGGTALCSKPVAGDCVVTAVTKVDRSPIESPVGTVPFYLAMVTLDATPEVRVMAVCAEAVEIGQPMTVTSSDGLAPYRLEALSCKRDT